MKRVLCLLAEGFEEIETITPVNLLRRAGAEVILAAVQQFHVTGRSGITTHADAMLADVTSAPFDLLFLPGGPGVKVLRSDGRAAALAREFLANGKIVAAICAAPVILADAQLLSDQTWTAHQSVVEEITQGTFVDQSVVISNHLVTSRGAGTALEFGLTLVAQLFGKETKRTIAQSIHAPLSS
jgi:protein deglycase